MAISVFRSIQKYIGNNNTLKNITVFRNNEDIITFNWLYIHTQHI